MVASEIKGKFEEMQGQEKGVSSFALLHDSIRHLIESGIISVGQRLPSERSLALRLKVSRTTVKSAYDELDAEGFLVKKEEVERSCWRHLSGAHPFKVSISTDHLLRRTRLQTRFCWI